ncbi:AAA family ATPase [Anseongella ginsenosidimutans]|nr:ATP-binding protein [Anseongella ginsenosidimutans]QEC51871.1 ATP-binding protein [Anseongella ginsenosidimutans]
MEAIIGRKEEVTEMQSLISSSQPEFLAVYGRRRVGKTYLIRNTYRERIVFQMTGFADASTAEQLSNYWSALKSVYSDMVYDAPPKDWMQAFEWLREYLESIDDGKKVIFFDELPWIDTFRSKFIQALGHFWNAWASDRSDIILVVCGSAASWMINKLINDPGGLHNRVTKRIRLDPFTLQETEAFLHHKHIKYDRYQTIQLYMSLGGIPYYLNELKPGRSVFQEIDRLCFSPKGSLAGEYHNLYRSLFRHADNHIAIVEALAKKSKGLTRDELIKQSGLSNGGYITKVIAELEESGFITIVYPFGKRIKNALYRLTDQFTLFYLKFMQDRKAKGEGAWLSRIDSPSWRAWSGYAFENVCFRHIHHLKKALGISGVYTEISSWQSRDQGAQIDLLIDRRDHVISVCEIKFSKDPYIITKSYRAELEKKLSVFRMETGTAKTVFLTFVTTMGLVPNQHSLGLVQNVVTLDALFE